MKQSIDVTLQIRDSAREPTTAKLEVEHISPGARAGRAALRLIGLWVLAVAAIMIPLLHFVLVPALAILGPVVAYLAFRATVKVLSTSVTCPKCQALSTIESGLTGWPVTLRCSSCSTTFFARPVATP